MMPALHTNSMDVVLVGTGPATAAVEAALAELNVSPSTVSPDDIESADLAVVRDERGAQPFERANRAALAGETAWLAIEVGGVGGRAAAGVGVAGFSPPETGCYDCLSLRVAASEDGSEVGPDSDERGRKAQAAGTERLAGAIVGHELVWLLDGGASPLLGGVRVVSTDSEARELLAVPDCHCQRPPAMFQLNYHQPYTPAETVDHAGRAVDERVGLIRRVDEFDPHPAAHVAATLSDTAAFSDGQAPRQVAAAGANTTEATARALERALARYSAALSRTDSLVCAAHSALELAVDPGEFVLPAEAETAGEHYWRLGRRLDDGTPGHLPAERVHAPPPTRRLGRPVAPGLGAGASTAGAVLDALYEVVADDAAMLSWYSTHRPPELSVADERFDRLRRRVEAEGLTVTPLLVTQDIEIPAVAVAVRAETQVQVAVAANLDPVAAAREALLQALARWRADGDGEIEDGDRRVAVDAFLDAAQQVAAADVGPTPRPTGFGEYLTAVDRAQAAGDPYGVRLTGPDVAELGIEVGAVVVPAAQPRADPPVFGERARRVPTERGLDPRLDRPRHPY